MGPFVDQFFTLSPYLLAGLASFTVGLLLLQGAGALAGRLEFGIAALATAAWNFLNFLEDAATTVPVKLALGNLQYALIGPTVVLFFLFTLKYLSTGSRRAWGWGLWGLFLLPLVTAVATWFDPDWGLVRSSFIEDGNLRWTWGPLFWAFWGQSLLLMGIALGLWIRWFWKDPQSGSRGTTFVLLAALVVLTGVFNTLWLLGRSPWPGHDPTPVVMGLMGVPILWAVVRSRFLPLLPQARRALMDAHREPVLVLGPDGRLVWYNPAAQVWGLTAGDLGRIPDQQTVDGRWNDGERIWDVDRVNLGTATEGVLVTYHDVTELETLVNQRTESLERTSERLKQELEARRRTEKQLFYFSLHDSMTGLPNRSLFLNRLESVGRARPLIVISVDFPDFGRVLARWGPGAGDEFIVQMARRLEVACEGQAFLARNAADRFLLFTEDLEPGEGLDGFLAQLQLDVGLPVVLGNDSLVPGLRIGWTRVEPGTSASEALTDADEARSRAAPGTVQAYQGIWRESERERLDLHAELGRALALGQLHLVYQPIVDLANGATVGYEALSRWNHPTRGTIPPNRFIPLAEESGLIRPLGLWVLREAVETFVSLGPEGPTPWVSVNVSPLQLATPGFAEFVTNLLERAGMAPSSLHLEITETALVKGEDLLPVIETLRQAGIHWKLDDFGTGYSSLAALHRLPVSSLKIDQSFIGRLPESLSVVKTILILARELGLEVVAEGVETREQESLLIDLGCALAQGYLYHDELTASELRKTQAEAKELG